MGMYGKYYAVNELMLRRILKGKFDIYNLSNDNSLDLDIDKSWDAIHFLLCNNKEDKKSPFEYVVPMKTNQKNENPSDLLYSAYITPKQVKEAYEAIKFISREDFYSMYDFSKLLENEIYPVLEGEDTEEFFDYIYTYFQLIRDFYKKICVQDLAILFFID